MIPTSLVEDSRIEAVSQVRNNSRAFFHFERPRLNQLFMEAVKYPLVVVCAGAGYGKTSAVHDFVGEYQAATAWIQLSERDNVGGRFWENYTHSALTANTALAKALSKIGFPDNKEKICHYKELIKDYFLDKKRILVIDDYHFIEDPAVLHFMEKGFFRDILPGTTVILISRSISHLNIAGMTYRDQIFNINENDLRFTENELAQYFRRMNIPFRTDSLREIMQDTEGWAFAINLIARSYQKAPGYTGYVRNAMKQNIFRHLEMEIWAGLSEPLQNFLVRLSLIDHLSVDLITQLAGNEEGFAEELEKQSAYVRRDSYINAYLIHPLFLEFLRTKQKLLSEEQKRETYAIAGAWCNRNGFRIDALSYYEKIQDYQSIVKMFFEMPLQIPVDICHYAVEIFDRAPPEEFREVEYFSEMHLRTYMCKGFLEKALDLAKYYESKFLKLPGDSDVNKRTLARIYIYWTMIRGLMCVSDDVCDFEIFMKKASECISTTVDPGKLSQHCPAVWIMCVGSARKGVFEEHIEAMIRVQKYLSSSNLRGYLAGRPELTRSVLEFYRGNMDTAESFVTLALKKSRESKQYGLIHRELFYLMRIAAAKGDFAQAEQALKETKALLDETEYISRFMDYDFSLSWYFCFLDMPEKTSEWLQEDISPYTHAGLVENFWNQIKARFCYATSDFAPILAYIEEMKMRESFLLGRIEMLAMEACIHHKMKNKEKAFAALRAAYEDAYPNEIVMPFIEMGKDMRTLVSAVLKEPDGKIPTSWLEDINRKSASYAKRRIHIITEYKKANGLTDGIVFSPREGEVLADLSHGLSRPEIAANRGLSVNTVKMVINMLYTKVGAENMADLIRVAVERKLI